jgi:hypothetical protein
VLAETCERGQRERQQLREPADQVVLLAPRTILKTSSSKLRRAATRALFESGLAGEHRRAGRWVVRLTGSGMTFAILTMQEVEMRISPK